MLRPDAEAFRRLNNLAGRFPWLDAIGAFCARWLIMAMFAAVLGRAFLAARRPEGRALALSLAAVEVRAVVAAALAFIGNWVFSLIVFRVRPFAALENVHRIIPEPITSHSFPSGHSSVAFALAFTMLFVDLPFGLALLVAATAVALGRVYVGVHYPLDVVAGIFVGLFWAVVVHFAASKLHDTALLSKAFSKLTKTS